MRDAAERENDAQIWQRVDRADQELPAGRDLRRLRLVAWWDATHGITDKRISQDKRVVRPRLVRAARKPVFEQRRVKEITGVIAGEGASGAVRAFQSGRQADDQEPRRSMTKGRHRRVVPFGMQSPRRLAKREKARTERTIARRLGQQRFRQVVCAA